MFLAGRFSRGTLVLARLLTHTRSTDYGTESPRWVRHRAFLIETEQTGIIGKFRDIDLSALLTFPPLSRLASLSYVFEVVRQTEETSDPLTAALCATSPTDSPIGFKGIPHITR